MGDKGSAWVLCPSKKLPGKFYYFNTQNGEKAWSWTDPSIQVQESKEQISPIENSKNFIGDIQAGYKLVPNNIVSSTIIQSESSGVGSPKTSTNNFINNTQAKHTSIQYNPVTSTFSKSREFGPPNINFNNCNSNTQTGYKLTTNNPVSSTLSESRKIVPSIISTNNSTDSRKRGYKQMSNNPVSSTLLQTYSRELGLQTVNTNNSNYSIQTGCKQMPSNPVSSTLLVSESRDFGLTNTSFNNILAGYKPMLNNQISSTMLQSQSREFMPATVNTNNFNTQAGYKVMPDNPVSSRNPIQLNTGFGEFSSPMTKESITKSIFEVMRNNPCPWRQPNENTLISKESMEICWPTKSSSVCSNDSQQRLQVMPNYKVSLREPKQLNKNIKRKCSLPITTTGNTQATYKPVLYNPFSARLPKPKHIRTISSSAYLKSIKQKEKKRNVLLENELENCAVKRTKMDCNLDGARIISGNPPSSSQNYFKNDNMNIDIKFLRNLTSKFIKEWHIVPDMEVLLEHLESLKEFISGDPTCSLMTPAAVLRKLQSPDCCTTEAKKVFQWLAKNSVCEINNQDEYVQDGAEINEEIIKFCTAAKALLHVVLVTKQKSLRDAAKTNGVHAYCLDELKMTSKVADHNITKNLFLQDTGNLDPFLIKKCTQTLNMSPNVFTDYINENNNNSTMKNLNWPSSKPNKNVGICFKRNDDRDNVDNNQENTMDNSCAYLQNVHINGNIKPAGGSGSQEWQNISNASFQSRLLQVQNSNIMICEDYDRLVDMLKDFCVRYSHLKDNIINRIDEWICCYMQIMEQFIHDIFQCLPTKMFEPPYWFQQGLKCLREHYSQNKPLCTTIDILMGMCGYCIKNGVVRTNIKTEQFLEILGAGLLLIEMIDKSSLCPEICKYYKKMINNLITTIQEPVEFPEMVSLSLELSHNMGDSNVMEDAEMI